MNCASASGSTTRRACARLRPPGGGDTSDVPARGGVARDLLEEAELSVMTRPFKVGSMLSSSRWSDVRAAGLTACCQCESAQVAQGPSDDVALCGQPVGFGVRQVDPDLDLGAYAVLGE